MFVQKIGSKNRGRYERGKKVEKRWVFFKAAAIVDKTILQSRHSARRAAGTWRCALLDAKI